MELRTTFTLPRSGEKISYYTPVIFIGSCFAKSIGKQLEQGRMPVLINPFGTVYNPVSVCNTLNAVIEGREFTIDDIFHYEDRWISFSHYTDFSSDNPEIILGKINSKIHEAHDFLSGANYLFVTFGTAWVYSWNRTGMIVSNCHKIPAKEFTRRMLLTGEIINMWSGQLEKLNSCYPDLKVIFTISPVRHWKDGAHGNQISKAVLFLAVEALQKHPLKPDYFPAYELVMDDLRDYRFYDTDMLHPSASAIEYIWDAFKKCYFDDKTTFIYKEVVKISKAVSHRLQSDSPDSRKKFAAGMLEKIESIMIKYPFINLSNEEEYFSELLK